MKMLALVGAVGVAVLLASSVSHSQTKPGDTIATVPFSFVVANEELPPGRYVITSIADGVLRIYTADSRGVAVPVHTTKGKAPESAGKLVFHRYGQTYFLSEVWTAGNDTGRELFRSKAEKETAVRQAKNEIAVLRAEE
jgi:hypothetical protein